MTNQVATNQTSSNVKTMSSREVAELTNKRHGHVIRDIETMLEALGVDQSKFGSGYLDANNQRRKCYLLPYRECEILITGYDVARRAKVIDRWLELETKATQPVQPQLPPSELQLTKDIIDSAITFGMSEAGLLAILGKEIPTDRNHHVIRTESSAERKRPVMRAESDADHSHPGFRTASARALALRGEYVDTDTEREIRVRTSRAARELCELMDCLDEDGFMIQR